MAQFKWSYTSQSSKRYVVGLYHGVRTGHLMIYCDRKIVQVDYNVRQSDTYSFFIEEELCEVSIEKRDDRFFYDFKINKDVNTPINQKRKKEKKDGKKLLITFIIGLTLFLSIGITYGYQQEKKRELEEKGAFAVMMEKLERTTFGIIENVYTSADFAEISFHYEDEKEGQKNVKINYDKDSFNKINKRHFPLQKGDHFLVKYHLDRNDAELMFNQTTEIQFQKYLQLAIQQEKKYHPNFPLQRVKCRVQCAFTLKKIAGLADFYFQNAATTANEEHNELSYKRLVRDIPFQKKEKRDCF